MEDIKSIIAANITALRASGGMTQLELAEKLHYSDKSVSKWERGESVPEIGTLTAIADLFGVPLDYLVRAEHEAFEKEMTESGADDDPDGSNKAAKAAADRAARKKKNHALVSAISVLLCWCVAALVFVAVDISFRNVHRHWLIFVWCVAASMIVWLVFNSIWFNRRRNYLIISLLMWSLLAAVHITVLTYHYNIWLIFTPGIPGQMIILLWSMLSFKH